MKRNTILIILLLFATFFSCRKDEIEIAETTEIENPIEIEGYTPEVSFINGDLFGQIVDADENPVQNAKISVEGNTVETNKYGTFSMNGIQMNALGTLITASKEGFVLGSRLVFPKEGELTRVEIKLLSNLAPVIIQANVGGTVQIEGGAEVTFESNSFVNLDGSEHLGNVHVITKYLDPTLDKTLDEMPGALVGINPFENNKEVALTTFGMILVELQTSEGNKLNLAPNTEAQIKIPVHQDLLDSAPGEIALSYFNESIGRWVEEERAVLEDGFYVGSVEHFTFWNCILPEDAVYLKITVTTEDGLPYANERVYLQTIALGRQVSGWTNAQGIVEGKVPKDIILKAVIKDNCQEKLYDKTIGAFSEDSEIDIVIDPIGFENTRISGSLICNGQTTNQTILVLDINGNNLFYYLNSSFELNLKICPEVQGQINAKFFDLNELTESENFSIEVEEENSLGLVNVCGQNIDEYISILFRGDAKTFPETSVKIVESLNPGHTRMIGQLGSEFINLHFHGLTQGDYSGETTVAGRTFYKNLVTMNIDGESADGFFEVFDVAKYGQAGEYIEGTFEGIITKRSEPEESYPMKGVFRVKVDDLATDGSYTELITEGYRYVQDDIFGVLFGVTFQSRSADHGNASMVFAEVPGPEKSLQSVFFEILDLSMLLQLFTPEKQNHTITNFGGVGEHVTGFSSGTHSDILRKWEDVPYYFSFSILNVPQFGTGDPIVPNLDEYISINYQDENTIFAEPSLQMIDFVNPGFTRISGIEGDRKINIHFHGLTAGDYSGQASSNGLFYHNNVVTMSANGEDTDGLLEDFIVTDFGVEGEYIIGSFSGVLDHRTFEIPHAIKGLFRIKIVNTEYDGSFTELITQGYRYVQPNIFGAVDSGNSIFFAHAGLNNNATIVIPENAMDERNLASVHFEVVHLRLFLQQGSGQLDNDEILSFGEVGEMVSGFGSGTYNDVYRGTNDEEFYFQFNILRNEDE